MIDFSTWSEDDILSYLADLAWADPDNHKD
jgi:hypothetical protein